MTYFRSILSIVFISITFTTYDAEAQISRGGTPPSFSATVKDSVPMILMPVVNVDSLLQNDTVNDFSYRFGYAFDVDMGLYNSGTWDTLTNGDRIWRLRISSPDAFSINLIYDDFGLPQGAEFFVYSEDRSMVLGAFTGSNNKSHNKFSTDLIKGDVTVLEYYEPVYASGVRINIDKVIHAYRNTFSGNGESGSCNIDVNCPQGDDWCVEKRAVSMILLDDNTRWCSGCLINNEREDLTPYYLTANHCLTGDESTWIFRFKYWSPNCNQGNSATQWASISGSSIKVNGSVSDFALLELNDRPPSGFGVLYAGWDRSSSPSTSGVGIHHPSGDVMKISLYDNAPVVAFVNGAGVNSWKFQFDQGVLEPGSSGSPMFNQDHLVVGQLYGTTLNNFLTCDNPTGDAVYGRFDVSWDNGVGSFLDPDNTGVTFVDATSPTIYLINRTLTGTYKFAALESIHVEGNVTTNGSICQPSSIPFTTEPGSNVEIRARRIVGKPGSGPGIGSHFKAGSYVHVKATDNIDCNDNPVEGDYVDSFCNAGISMRMAEVSDTENEQIAVRIPENMVIYPNPNSGTFTIVGAAMQQITIMDASGKLVKQFNANLADRVEISGLGAGLYIVRAQMADGSVETDRVVVAP